MTITIIEREEDVQQQIDNGTDQVVASMPIPPGGTFLGFRTTVEGIAIIHQNVLLTSRIDLKAAIVPLGGSMMDTGLSIQTIWDQMIPKDADLSVVAGEDDIDWDDGAVATNFEEPGQINWNDMLQLGVRPTILSRRTAMASLRSGGRMPHVDTTDEYFPTVGMRVGSNKKVRVQQASMFMLAMSSPNFDETVATPKTSPANANWSLLTYPDVMVKMMLPDILGLTETGAESPFSDAAQFLLATVEPPVMENNTGAWHPVDWRVWAMSKMRILTPGEPRMGTLRSHGG